LVEHLREMLQSSSELAPGIDNLWIVDASVIPEITAGPIHASVIAIAESFVMNWNKCV
jgi:choline dehydrogenase-like flavoprotein